MGQDGSCEVRTVIFQFSKRQGLTDAVLHRPAYKRVSVVRDHFPDVSDGLSASFLGSGKRRGIRVRKALDAPRSLVLEGDPVRERNAFKVLPV